MNFVQIELLHVLKETGLNLTRAANELKLVQSGVSRQLLLLESELGGPLIVRKSKKLIEFTALGRLVMEETESIIKAKQNIHSLAADYRNIIHVATTHAQAKYFLPGPIGRFRQKYPRVRIYLNQNSPANLVEQLHQFKADLAVCTEEIDKDSELITQHCYEWHHALVVPHGHPLSQVDIKLHHLAEYPILTYSFGYTGRSTIETVLNEAGLKMDVVLSAADSDVIKAFVRLGLGVGLITCMAYDKSADSDLVMRSLSKLIPSSSTKIAYLKNNYIPHHIQHFIDEMLLAAKNIKNV